MTDSQSNSSFQIEPNSVPPPPQEYTMNTDPLFKEVSGARKEAIDKAVEKKIRSLTLDENIDKDTPTVPGQNYALISIVAPQANQKSDNCCLKIKGVFSSLEDANKHADMLQKIDDTFDIYVVEMYSWLLVPPDPELLEQKHVDSKLNEIIGGHRESQLKSKMYFEERKRELMENIEIENETRREENEQIKEEPVGVSAESSVDITDNSPDGANCPNSGPESSPSELMEAMINQIHIQKPSESWADKVES